MGTKTAIGLTLLIVGVTAIPAGVVTYKKMEERYAYTQQPITAVVVHDSIRICSAHGGIDKFRRIAADIYNLQCKDGAWFLNLKLANIATDKPKVTLKEIM